MVALVAIGLFAESAFEPVPFFDGPFFNRSFLRYTADPINLPLPTLPIPSSPGTNYSFVSQIALVVMTPTAPPTTLVSATFALQQHPDRDVGEVLPEGLTLFYRPNTSYLDQTAFSAGPADVLEEDLGNPATPPGYTAATITPLLWDEMGIPGNTGVPGRVSMFLDLVMGVSSIYAGAESPQGSFAGTALISYGEF